MIKKLPGWLNFIGLFSIYFIVGILLDLACGFHTDKRFIGLLTSFFAGGYLAKWRFMDGGWRFF